MQKLHQQTRRKFKNNGPIFDEASYRTRFYNMVLATRRLFFASEESILNFIRQPPESLESLESQLQLIIEKELRQKLEQESLNHAFEGLQNQIVNTEDKLLEFLKQIDELIRFMVSGSYKKILQIFGNNQEENKSNTDSTNQNIMSINNESQMEDPEMKILNNIMKLLHKIQNLIELPEKSDSFKFYYEINYKMCLQLLFSNNARNIPLTKAVFFSKTVYESGNQDMKNSFVKKGKKNFKIASDLANHLTVVSRELQEKIRPFFVKISDEEDKIRRALISDPHFLAGNIIYEFHGELESKVGSKIKDVKETVDLTNLLKDPLKKEEIKKFREENFGAYMSSASVTDYEKFMDSHTAYIKSKSTERILEGLRDFVNNLKNTTQEEQIIEKSIVSLFSESALFQQLHELVCSDPVFEKFQRNFSKDTLKGKLESLGYEIRCDDSGLPLFNRSNKFHARSTPQKFDKSKKTYFLSLKEGGISFIPFNSDTPNKYFRVDVDEKLAERPKNEKVIVIRTSKELESYLNHLNFCWKVVHGKDGDYVLKEFKAHLMIYFYDQENDAASSLRKFSEIMLEKNNKNP